MLDQKAIVSIGVDVTVDRSRNRMEYAIALYGRDGKRIYDQKFEQLWDQLNGVANRSLSEISQSVRGAFRQWLPGTDSALKNNFVTIAGKVLAMIAHEYELRAERLVLNCS